MLTPDKLKTFEILGNACAVCGEKEKLVFVIDHIHGDGKEHRREPGYRGIEHYVINNPPEEVRKRVQILCANCNHIKTWHPDSWDEYRTRKHNNRAR